jgi:hypothetical protein
VTIGLIPTKPYPKSINCRWTKEPGPTEKNSNWRDNNVPDVPLNMFPTELRKRLKRGLHLRRLTRRQRRAVCRAWR